jgi:succinyl-CoA:acetate CoA-transferase
MPFKDRIRCKGMLDKVACPQEAARIIKNGMTVGVSGYTPTGYPKVIPMELVKRSKSGEDLKITLFGPSVGPEIDHEMTKAGIINRRLPFQGNKTLSQEINSRKIKYAEAPLGKSPQLLRSGFLGEIDVAIIEALAITEEGWIVPTTSIGLTPAIAEMAKEIIIEINISSPIELEGLHDIYIPNMPPNRKPIPLTYVTERIGEPFIKIDKNKIKFIVISDLQDTIDQFTQIDFTTSRISHNLMNFLELEVKANRLPKNLLPIQSGVGNLANGLVYGFKESNFKDLTFYCGILQESILDLIETGHVIGASGGGFTPTTKAVTRVKNNPKFYRETMVLRPADISNNPEVIGRLGLISLNNAIEVDLYGNVNTSHILGSKVVNGIGGGTEFAQNSYLSIILLPSTGKRKDVSTIVPMVSHVDIIEHHVDVIITDLGVADLRGKDPEERAWEIINICADPHYKEELSIYLDRAIKEVGGHQPHLLGEAYQWHLRMIKEGKMK